ncbi:hypothetical protein GOODEAATRI_000706 [Goodea atripinnis]|uniref:Uncharacterized protein n=1 Tax=Goodea atripinnis TaxID=208336 RepID=A0ABV0PA82_9TELE
MFLHINLIHICCCSAYHLKISEMLVLLAFVFFCLLVLFAYNHLQIISWLMLFALVQNNLEFIFIAANSTHVKMSNLNLPCFLVFSSTTPVVATPSSKRKLPLELRHSFGLSNKKRRSVKKNLGTELLPSTLFSRTSTPGSVLQESWTCPKMSCQQGGLTGYHLPLQEGRVSDLATGMLPTDTPLTTSHKGNYMSEPAIVVSKPSPASVLPKNLCCTSSSESLKSACSIAEPLRRNDPAGKIQNDVTELENDLQASKRGFCSSVGESGIKSSAKIPGTPALAFEVDIYCPPTEADEQNVTFGQFNIEALTPLHIDSGVFESSANCSPVINRGLSPPFGRCSNSTLGSVERVPQQMNCSRLIDALDIQSPAHFSLGVPSGLQSTPYRPGVELEDEPNTPSKTEILGSKSYEEVKISPESGAKVKHQPSLSPDGLQTQKRRVVDHIQHFNKLTLYSPTSSKNKQIRSPMKFQRTPVKLTVRRINSLTGESRRPSKLAELTARQAGHVTKTLSLESGLSPQLRLRPQVERSNSTVPVKKPPPVPPKRLSTLPRKVTPCALGDMTNKVLPKARMECSVSDPSAAQKPFIVQQVDKNNMSHYRGSPRNPLNHGQLLSATKPVDL